MRVQRPMDSSRRLLRQGLALTLALAVVTCTDTTDPTPTETTPETGPTLFRTPTGLMSAVAPEIFVGAGDIASCSKTGDSETAALLDNIPGEIFLLGDNVYPNGTTAEFADCYHPTWGRHKARTHPSAGNHDYNTSGAGPYYAYFGAAAGPAGKGYYSFTLGAWHVIVLNSNISMTTSSAQVAWLRADLAANQNLCTVAYFHHPLYSSTGGTGSGGRTYSSVRPLYDELYQAGADLVMAGHRHFYERLGKLRPDGSRDNVYGTRHMIVGTGGIGGGSVTNQHPGSEVADGETRGVLKLYLYEDSYAWKFIPVAGKTFTDSGSTACHPAPSSGGSGTVSASQSTVTASPTSLTASNGASSSTITVTVKNSSGNPISGANVVLSATGTGNTVTQPSGPTNGSGVATGTLSSTGAGQKTVSATANGTGITQKPVVTVDAAAKTALGFQVQPSNTSSNSSISPAVKVQVRDQFGNRVSGATDNVTIAIGNNPGSGTLGGTKTVAAVDGEATFSNLSIDNAGTGYTLMATASGLSNATSAGFNITASAPTISAALSTVVANPSSISAGTGTSDITVTVKDPSGVPIPGVAVTLSATGSGNTLGQPSNSTNNNGVATGTLSSTVAGDKTITAVAGGVTLNDKPVVTVTGSSGPPSTIQHSLLTVGANPTNQKVFTTGSISPAPNALVTVAVLTHRSPSAADSPTLSGGGMSAWTEVASVTFDDLTVVHKRLTIFRAMSASPGSGPLTITSPQTVSNAEWIVSQWTGVDQSGSNGAGAIGQTGSNRANASGGLTVSLAPFQSPNNVAYGAFGVASNTARITPGSGFTEIAEQPSTESTTGDVQTEWATNQNTINATWSNLNGGALGVEIKASP